MGNVPSRAQLCSKNPLLAQNFQNTCHGVIINSLFILVLQDQWLTFFVVMRMPQLQPYLSVLLRWIRLKIIELNMANGVTQQFAQWGRNNHWVIQVFFGSFPDRIREGLIIRMGMPEDCPGRTHSYLFLWAKQ